MTLHYVRCGCGCGTTAAGLRREFPARAKVVRANDFDLPVGKTFAFARREGSGVHIVGHWPSYFHGTHYVLSGAEALTLDSTGTVGELERAALESGAPDLAAMVEGRQEYDDAQRFAARGANAPTCGHATLRAIVVEPGYACEGCGARFAPPRLR